MDEGGGQVESPAHATRVGADPTVDGVADVDQLDFPIVYCVAREGRASLERPGDGAGLPEGTTLQPLLDLLVDRIPAPSYDPDAPLQALVTNLDSSPYVGRLALCIFAAAAAYFAALFLAGTRLRHVRNVAGA